MFICHYKIAPGSQCSTTIFSCRRKTARSLYKTFVGICSGDFDKEVICTGAVLDCRKKIRTSLEGFKCISLYSIHVSFCR